MLAPASAAGHPRRRPCLPSGWPHEKLVLPKGPGETPAGIEAGNADQWRLCDSPPGRHLRETAEFRACYGDTRTDLKLFDINDLTWLTTQKIELPNSIPNAPHNPRESRDNFAAFAGETANSTAMWSRPLSTVGATVAPPSAPTQRIGIPLPFDITELTGVADAHRCERSCRHEAHFPDRKPMQSPALKRLQQNSYCQNGLERRGPKWSRKTGTACVSAKSCGDTIRAKPRSSAGFPAGPEKTENRSISMT